MLLDDLALLFVPGLGSLTAARLVDAVGSSRQILSSPLHRLVGEYGLKESVARSIVTGESYKMAEKEVNYCRKNDIEIITVADERYPEPLREAVDRPHVLFVRGSVEALSMRTLSMVGTREMSPSGHYVVDRLIAELGAKLSDLCIVSGLAYGVDAACHRAALAHDVKTVAVVANVLPDVQPAPHRALAEDILRRGGAIVSELHSQTKQNGRQFVARNRIIAAMSMGTLVVESPASGGSLVTADMADGYHRTVMALPGRITDANSFGTNNLIRSGKARLVLTADDIIEDMDWEVTNVPTMDVDDKDRLEGLTSEQMRCLEALGGAVSMDVSQILAATAMTIGELTMALIELEMRGLVRQLPGQRYERV